MTEPDNENSITRTCVPELDKLIGEKIPVLDDGFVRLIDYFGDDSAIVQAARVSYGKGTKKRSEDKELIRYLMRHWHTSPFEMCEIKLHVRLPMDCWRQWIRHRTANVNEYSTRYSIAIDAMASTKPGEWRMQDYVNRQGSSGNLDLETGKSLSEKEKEIQKACRQIYQDRLDIGVAREQARKDLPLSTYTEAYWKIDLHNLLHFLMLRMKLNAQHEIREYANTIGYKIVGKWVPIAWQAFLDYQLNAMSLSEIEIGYLSMLASGKSSEALEGMMKRGWVKMKGEILSPNLEAMEFGSKLERLGIPLPWHATPAHD
ncbi:MAG: FAD-dependent thymidylate synthase [bacterium]|nr:FAD-dependent thymidylate synthase [bacterium]